MTRTWVRLSVAKEVRALSLPWLVTLVAWVGIPLMDVSQLLEWRLPAYWLGMTALGALSIGHEYSYRTLAALLSQPASRGRLFLVKLCVLAGMLLTLGSVATIVALDPGGFQRYLGVDQLELLRRPVSVEEKTMVLVLPVFCGLFVAPWLTMLCRSPLAGTLFTMGTPGCLLIAGELIGGAKYGIGAEADAFRLAFLWQGTLIVCAVAAVMSWRMFMRLEAIEGPQQEVDVGLPPWLRRRSVTTAAAPALTRRHPLWVLARKEIRLQQMTLAVAGVYLIIWLLLLSLRSRLVDWQDDVFLLVTSLYFGLLSLLIGSLASAEERQLGTLPSQVLLPFSTWKQWAIKVGMASGLALLLTLGLPMLLAYLSAIVQPTFPSPSVFIRPQTVVAVVMLTTVGLYVSSVSTSGLQAMLFSSTALLGAAFFVRLVVESLAPMASALARPFSEVLPLVVVRRIDNIALHGDLLSIMGHGLVVVRRIDQLALLLVAGFIVLALRFALVNHRSADRPAGRVVTQVGWLAVYVAIAVAAVAGMAAFPASVAIRH